MIVKYMLHIVNCHVYSQGYVYCNEVHTSTTSVSSLVSGGGPVSD